METVREDYGVDDEEVFASTSSEDESLNAQDSYDDLCQAGGEGKCRCCFSCVFKLLHQFNMQSYAYSELYKAYKFGCDTSGV